MCELAKNGRGRKEEEGASGHLHMGGNVPHGANSITRVMTLARAHRSTFLTWRCAQGAHMPRRQQLCLQPISVSILNSHGPGISACAKSPHLRARNMLNISSSIAMCRRVGEVYWHAKHRA